MERCTWPSGQHTYFMGVCERCGHRQNVSNFTVRITGAALVKPLDFTYEYASMAWSAFGLFIEEQAENMHASATDDVPFNLVNIAMVYMIDTRAAVEYARVTIA